MAGHGLRELAAALRDVATSQRVAEDHLFFRGAAELERCGTGRAGIFLLYRDEAEVLAGALRAACGPHTSFRRAPRGT